MIQFVQHVQEMANGSCDAVKSSNEHDVKAVSPSICHQLVKSWPLRLAPRNYVCEFAHDFASALLGHFAEVEQLRFDVLVARTHTCVDNGAFLHFNSFFLEIRYASMARRTNSATGAPVFLDNFWSFFNCCSFKNRAVRFIGKYGTIPAYISGVSAERRSHHYGNRSASLQRITSNEKRASGPSERRCLDTRFKDAEWSFRTPVDSARVRRISKPDEPV